MGERNKVLLVGHCGPDAYMLRSKMRQLFPAATVELVNDDQTLNQQADGQTLLLVNRVLDGAFAVGDGVSLIRQQRAAHNGDGAAAMLVSNFPEAQAQAVAAGALPGFGKAELGTAVTEQRLREAMDAH